MAAAGDDNSILALVDGLLRELHTADQGMKPGNDARCVNCSIEDLAGHHKAVTGQDGAPRFVIFAPPRVSSAQDWLRLHAPHDFIEDDVGAEEGGSPSASHMPARV